MPTALNFFKESTSKQRISNRGVSKQRLLLVEQHAKTAFRDSTTQLKLRIPLPLTTFEKKTEAARLSTRCISHRIEIQCDLRESMLTDVKMQVVSECFFDAF